MKFEILRKSHLKRNIIIGVVCIAIISAIVLNFTRVKYRTTQSIPLVNGTINYAPYDLKMVAMYQEEDGEYKSIDTVPTSGYSLNEEKSYCEINNAKDNTVSMEYKNGKVYIGVTKKGTKCYLYFDKQILAKDTILANSKVNEGTPDFSKTATTDEGIYKAEDDWGESYYFRGAVTNNYVKFAGFYWRIIRINGDGSIRLIYDGTSLHNNGESSNDKQIISNVFNNSYQQNEYVGYIYTLDQVHGLDTESQVKKALDSWYKTNIMNENYENKISTEVGFCGDREPSTNQTAINGSGGIGSAVTYYGSYIRLITNKIPTLKCTNKEDLYTSKESKKGNNILTYPIGLITADEVSMAGGVFDIDNTNYYLYSNSYWTMTPRYFNGALAYVFLISSTGNLNGVGVAGHSHGVRPVINLSNDVEIKSGNGTISAPYEISD